MFFTVGVEHRFSAYVTADEPAQISLEVGGEFDGQAKSEQKSFEVGTNWKRIELDFTPPVARSARVSATISVPEGATVLLDCVTFRPTEAAAAALALPPKRS